MGNRLRTTVPLGTSSRPSGLTSALLETLETLDPFVCEECSVNGDAIRPHVLAGIFGMDFAGLEFILPQWLDINNFNQNCNPMRVRQDLVSNIPIKTRAN